MPATSGVAKRVAVLVGVGALALALGFLAGRRGEPKPLPAPPEQLRDRAAVIVAVRGLARLEAVSYHVERVIDLTQPQLKLFGLVEADDSILLVAAGDAVAGIDLQKLQDGDVIVEPRERRVRLRAPAPELLWVRLDNERTYVHSRDTDLLAERDETMETRARQHAEASIREAALQSDILGRARQSAQHTLTVLVRALGYDRVEVTWTDGAAAVPSGEGR